MLIYYSEKYAVQRTHKEAHSRSKVKRSRLVHFIKKYDDMNIRDTSTAPKKRGGWGLCARVPKSEPENVSPEEDSRTYGIDRLNLAFQNMTWKVTPSNALRKVVKARW